MVKAQREKLKVVMGMLKFEGMLVDFLYCISSSLAWLGSLYRGVAMTWQSGPVVTSNTIDLGSLVVSCPDTHALR